MTALVTGAAGFIGFHLARRLLSRGDAVIGVDDLNSYYDPALKRARLELLQEHRGFRFERADVADRNRMFELADLNPGIEQVVHLAAQAGVRHSLVDPWSYVDANVHGHLTVMEAARRLPRLRHLVYASSSSVYGGNTKMPLAVGDPVEDPVSAYAATKRAAELLSQTYAHLHRLPMTGLRFFTVYGPWGRPDMAYYLFTRAILRDEPIEVFNHGRMRRDFTYVDDVVDGVVAAMAAPPGVAATPARPHRIYNLGNSRSEDLGDFIAEIERAVGRPARRVYKPMQPGDVVETYADVEPARRDLGFAPTTPIQVGVPRFVEWYRSYAFR